MAQFAVGGTMKRIKICQFRKLIGTADLRMLGRYVRIVAGRRAESWPFCT